MSDPAPTEDAAPRKRKLPLILGLVGLLLAGGGGFFAARSGLILGHHDTAEAKADPGLPDLRFVPVPPLVISLPPGSSSSHLRFAAQLETGDATAEAAVQQLLPRIQDVLNGYLRAVQVAELEDPATLVRMRAQLLRRIQLVAGEDRVRDLLITEFVLN